MPKVKRAGMIAGTCGAFLAALLGVVIAGPAAGDVRAGFVGPLSGQFAVFGKARWR